MKSRRFLLPLLFLAVGCSKSGNVEDPVKPRLIVFLSLDQFRYDYLSLFEDHFVPDGLNFLIRQGALFDDCKYLQATTHTAVGHSIMASGSYPYKTGIVANDWYDDVLGRSIYSVYDPDVRMVGAEERTDLWTSSPRNFIGSTVGDQLKLHTMGRAKVFSISNKDRAAILMGGKMADAAYWINDDVGEIVTSTYYMDRYPDWMLAYRKQKPLTRWMGREWTLTLPEGRYPVVDRSLRAFYDVKYGMGATFPHTIGSAAGPPTKDYFHALRSSPFGAEAIIEFAEKLVIEEKLGQHEETDLLCLSISVTDRVAHEYGPMSAELMDAVIKLDRYLSSFFQFIGNEIGQDQVLYVLTADHGGAPIPEVAASLGMEAGRINSDSVQAFIETIMQKKYGRLSGKYRYVAMINDPNIYLNETVLSEKNIDKKAAEDYIARSLKTEFRAIYRIYRDVDILSGDVMPDMISEHVVRSFFPERSGDLVVVLKPYYVWDWSHKGTDHGQPYAYDTHVPLVFAGQKWIKAGRYAESCSPADIAPTLSEILQIEFPTGNDGIILSRALHKTR